MLTPKYLQDCPARMVELYSQLETDILSDMARKIQSYDVFSASVDWQKERVRLMGESYDEIMKRLSLLTGKTRAELKKLLKDAGIKTLKADDEVYTKAGKRPTPLDASESLQKVLSVGLRKTAGTFSNLTKTTAKNGSRQFVEALDRAYMQVTSGAFDANTAIRRAINDLAERGLTSVRYKNRSDTIETAVRRAVITGVNQTCGMLQEARAEEMECDLVEVTAHAGARPSHAEWQGKIYSRSGTHPKYPSLVEATGYGSATGLKGVNCRHDFYPFIEGVSEPAYEEEELTNFEEARDYTYNGQEMTEYEATQQQRYIERQIRKYKRKQQVLKAAGLPDKEATSKVTHWNKVMDDFLRQTGLKEQIDRELIGRTNTIKTKAGLSAGNKLTNNQQQSIARKVGQLEKANEETARKYFAEQEKEIVKQKYETAIIVTGRGEVFKVDGTSNGVNINAVGEDNLSGAFMTHNHPIEETYYSFSAFDISEALRHKFALLRGIDEKYIYELRTSSKTIDPGFDEVYHLFNTEIRYEALEQGMTGKINIDTDEYDYICQKMAEKYHFEYKRFKHDDQR